MELPIMPPKPTTQQVIWRINLAHALYHLRKKVVNTPQLMSLSEFENVIEYLDNSDGREVKVAEKLEEDLDHNSRYTIYRDDAAALFTIEGPMTYKPFTIMGMDCGGFSYQQFKQDFSYAVEQGVKTVGLILNSGGGEAHQLFPTMNSIRKLADKNDVKILAYVDGVAASAAYATAAIADEIILSEGSQVGSIGVVVRLMNDNQKLQKEGYKRTFIQAGEDKTPFDAEGEFKESFLQDIQQKVDVMYKDFVSHVASYRNISEEQVKATEARIFLPEEALALGLADRVMGVDEFYLYISQLAESRMEGDMKLPTNPFTFNKTALSGANEDVLKMQQLEELQAAHEQLTAVMVEKETAMLALGEQVATLTAAMQEKETLLADAVEKLAEMEATTAKAQAEAKLAERTAQLSEVMPKEEATTTAASLEALADDAFGVVLSGYQRQYAAMQQSEMFQQLSTSAPVETQQDTQEATLENPAVAASRAAMKARGL